MSSTSELETLVQQALVREKEQGTGKVLLEGHDCRTPTGQYNQSLGYGSLWQCSCGRKFRKQPRRVYSNWNNSFRGVDPADPYWQEVGLRKLARGSAARPLTQAITIIMSLLALLVVPVLLGVIVNTQWLHLFWLVVLVVIAGPIHLWPFNGVKRWRAG